MTAPAITWGWRPRALAAEPQAAVGWSDAARRLHQRLATLPEAQAARLQATANRDVLVVCGAAEDLPWVNGVEYAASDERAPGLWLPTSWEPEVPLDLLGQALAHAFSRTPLLLWREPQAVVPLDRQLPLTPQHLQRIAENWTGR